MQFEKYFKIKNVSGKVISLGRAVQIAKKKYLDNVYDPLGLEDERSWYWCAALLHLLEQEGLISGYKILRRSPVKAVHVKGKVY